LLIRVDAAGHAKYLAIGLLVESTMEPLHCSVPATTFSD
jgi:hypothetical protein